MKRLVSGIKPTNSLTLGNYIGAIRQFIKMQDEYEAFFFVADLHSITVPQEPEELTDSIRNMVAVYLACGLDPKKSTIFLQSENEYHANVSWILGCNTYMGELSRMTQYKDKVKKQNDVSLSSGLFTYPVLMASDIIIYDADVVPVGEDQKQHVELTRNIATRFNNKFGETFKVPEPVIPKEGARIKDLQDPTKKMSKSDETGKGSIFLLDEEEVITKKIMSAVTDSDNAVKFDEENKAGISNLITIYAALKGLTILEVEEKFKDSNYGEFKRNVAEAVNDTLRPIRENYNEIIKSDMVDQVLDEGLKKVLPLAKAKLEAVKDKVGLKR